MAIRHFTMLDFSKNFHLENLPQRVLLRKEFYFESEFQSMIQD